MARGPISSHPLIASELYPPIAKVAGRNIHTVRTAFYNALSKDSFFRNMRKRGDLRYEVVSGGRGRRSVTRWHFTEEGARHATNWLSKKYRVEAPSEQPTARKSGVGVNLYRLCASLGVEPVFDGVTLDVDETPERLTKDLV